MHGRRTGQTDRSYEIRWREQNTEKRRKSGMYNAGVKDLASAYVLCPRLAEYGVFRFTDGIKVHGVTRGLGVELCC